MDSPVQPVTPTAGPTGFEDLIPKKKGAQGPSVGGSTGFDDLIPAKPGILSQIGHGLEQSYSAIRHPEQTVSALVHGIKQSAEDAITPAVGERNTMGGSPGALAVTGFDKQGNPTYNSQVITKENTPGAITKGEKLRGEVNTLANIALPGVGGEVTGHLINAGLGAINDPEQPIRGATAGLIIGGLLHAPKMLHGAADVSEGMVPRDLGSDAKYQEQVNPIERLSPNRRPLYTLPENQRPPVEPPPEAEAQSFGGRTGRRIINPADQPEAPAPPVEPPPEAEAKTFGNTPLTDLTDEQKALRARLALEHGIPPEAIDDITRRAMNVKPPVEPGEDATTQSFGGRVGRRPAGEVVPPESPTAGFDDLIPPETKTNPVPVVDTDKLPTNGSDDQETPTGQLGTPVSYDALGKLDDVHPRLEPIVSSNGNFDARPGVLNRVNKDFTDLTPASPSRIVMPQRYAPGETASIAPAEAQAAPEPLASTPKNVSADELINRSKLDLDPEGEKAFQAETERAKAEGLDKTKVTFETQRAAANEFAKSINMDPTTLDPLKTAKLSGAQIVGLKNVLSKNLNDMGAVSKKLADPDISVEDAEKLNDHLDGLRKQNDALMSKIVSETSEKGRDLGFLRQMSNATLDPDVWAIQARKVAGRMLSDDEIATVQGLAKAAADACAGGA